MKVCPHYSVVMHGKDAQPGQDWITRARCKRWSCEYCAAVNRRVWLYRIGAEVESDDATWYFWTLTLDGRDHDGNAVNSVRVWRAAWDKLFKRVRRALGAFRYLRVFEQHADGTLHVHLLADATFDDVVRRKDPDGREYWYSATLERHLTAVGLGWRHDLREIEHRDHDRPYASAVAGYLGKYLTKQRQGPLRDVFHAAGETRVRMLQTSRGWAKLEKTTSNDAVWTPVRSISRHMWEWRYHVDGVDTIDLDVKEVLSERHFYADRWPIPDEDIENYS